MAILESREQVEQWLAATLDVSRETLAKLERLEQLVREEADRQNLIARSTFDTFWQRHIADSAQLLLHSGPVAEGQLWLDLGSGAGFPGLVVALIAPVDMVMVESRRRRIDFLDHCIAELGIASHTRTAGKRIEMLESFPADYISARAFAPLERLIELATGFSTDNTVWLLPKGRNAAKELESLSRKWQSVFHVEQSLTDADAHILLGRGRPRDRHRFRSSK